MKFVSSVKRTHYCGELNAQHQNQTVVVMGWVDSRRDHGGLVFVDLRDREGIVQIVLNPAAAGTAASKDLRGEYVVAVQGQVRLRPQGMTNSKIKTGEIEIEATNCEILSVAQTPPFQFDDPNVSETLRLKYRYLDLRSPRLQSHLILRHKVTRVVREYLSDMGFLEVETPILYKSTPEGARDYLVPSRVNPGTFYALPQSPQTLKQLLMISGYDRYFQIARCFRDEDLRADRQPEFSQIDIEMSFVDVEDVIAVNEGMARALWKKFRGVDIGEIPRLTYKEAMNRYGNDKPDLRFGMELQDLTENFRGCGFKVFEDVVERSGSIKAIVVPGGGSFSRSQFDKLTDIAKQMGAKGLVWMKGEGDKGISSSVSKFFTPEKLKEIFVQLKAGAQDAVLIVADDWHTTCAALAHLRLHLGKELKLIDTSKDRFLWVVDFPLLEFSKEDQRWMACHHPFTSPKDESIDIMLKRDEKNYKHLLARAYDFVCNGNEIAGGSIRIHRQEVQQAMFETLGLSAEETQLKFGYFLEALKYGTPPHGGIAWGMDRLVMILSNTEAIREVIAFPKTAKASCLMSESPSPVSRQQLLELHIRLNPSLETAGQKKDSLS